MAAASHAEQGLHGEIYAPNAASTHFPTDQLERTWLGQIR